MNLRTRIIRLEGIEMDRTQLTDLHRRLGIIDGRPDRSDPVQRMASAIGGRPQDRANFAAYLDAVEAFGREGEEK